MIYLYLITILLLVFSARLKSTMEKENTFTLKNTNVLKGFFALMVLVHHLGEACKLDGLFGKINSYLGPIAVGAFFFLSAYGLIKSYQKNNDYVKKIFFVKIPLLYFLQVLINSIYYLIFFTKSNLSTLNIVVRIFNLDIFFNYPRMNGYSWFITTILFMYIILGVVLLILRKFKFKKEKLIVAITMHLIVIALIITVNHTPISSLYISALECFPLGIWLSFYEKEICKFLNKKYLFYISIILIPIILTVFSIFYKTFNWWNCEFFPSLVCLFLVLICQKLTFEKSVTYTILGKISLEFYLLQLIFIEILGLNFATNQFFKGLAVIGATFIASYLFKVCFDWFINLIKQLIEKLRKNGNEENINL